MTAARYVQASFVRACVVPKVKGNTLKTARHKIKAGGCHVGKIRHAFSAKVKRGHVLSQRPKPHTRRKRGAKVNLIVSKG